MVPATASSGRRVIGGVAGRHRDGDVLVDSLEERLHGGDGLGLAVGRPLAVGDGGLGILDDGRDVLDVGPALALQVVLEVRKSGFQVRLRVLGVLLVLVRFGQVGGFEVGLDAVEFRLDVVQVRLGLRRFRSAAASSSRCSNVTTGPSAAADSSPSASSASSPLLMLSDVSVRAKGVSIQCEGSQFLRPVVVGLRELSTLDSLRGRRRAG